MTTFRESAYELFFSNNLQTLRALNYADELFFAHFERLCGARYRILSVIRKGWQEKYGRTEDIQNLADIFSRKLKDPMWIASILSEYESGKEIFLKILKETAEVAPSSLSSDELSATLLNIRERSAVLDAMSNMLHIFSTMPFADMLSRLKTYGTDAGALNKNFIFYTQPVRESRLAKILIPELSDRFTLSEEDAALSAILRAGAYIKDDVSALLEERVEKSSGIFSEIAARLSIEPEDVYFLTLSEIDGALRAGRVSRELIESRKKITVIFYSDRALEIYEGTDAERLLSSGNFRTASVASNGERKGQPASPGKASGRCVVVRDSNEAIRLMNQGDILVAPYTAPEYLPAMKKAAAIITETGGITAHAAIVSRELKIPCVIGVKGATTLLQTGDMVEVDADNGIVRKM